MSGNDSLRFIPALLSLQDSAINTIVENIGSYRDLIKKKIAPPMRKILFDEAMKRIKDIGEDQVWAALPYLDQHRTTERFSTEDFASIFRLKGKKGEISEGLNISMEEFLQYLVQFVPNLRELKIHDPRTSWSKKRAYKKIELEPLATDLLLNMANLTHLSINGVKIKFSGFLSVCSGSQNLQSIQAKNILVDIRPLNSIKNILETLDSKFDQRDYDFRKFPEKIGITFKMTSGEQPYREAELTLSNDFLDLTPSGFTQLRIFAQKPADILSERNFLLRILSREGGSLKSLFLHEIVPELNITLQNIFEHCHELENFGLHSSYVRHDDHIASFGKLKILNWLDYDNAGTVRLDTLFSAPLLRQIFIVASKLDLGDKESLVNQIRNRSILTELRDFWIFLNVHQGQSNFNVAELHELGDVLRSSGVVRVEILE